jgi:hypothetical protein
LSVDSDGVIANLATNFVGNGSGGIACNIPFGGPFAASSCGVAWADSAGIHWSLLDAQVATSDCISSADTVIAPGAGPVVNLSSDGTYIYWTDNGTGAIGKLRRP